MVTGQRVAVYRNLHRACWSVRAMDGPERGKVIGHVQTITLVDCHMHVGLRAQQRIAAGAPREVHAWIVGRVAGGAAVSAERRLTYRPHERADFHIVDTGQAVHSAALVVFGPQGAFV